VVNLPNPPASANEYKHDHAQLLVRYMLSLTPDEQRRLLATAPVAPPAANPSASPQASIRGKKPGSTARRDRKSKRGSVLARAASVRSIARGRGL